MFFYFLYLTSGDSSRFELRAGSGSEFLIRICENYLDPGEFGSATPLHTSCGGGGKAGKRLQTNFSSPDPLLNWKDNQELF